MCSALNASRSDYTRTCFDNAQRMRLPKWGEGGGRTQSSVGSFRSYRFVSCVACEGDRQQVSTRTGKQRKVAIFDEKSVAYIIARLPS